MKCPLVVILALLAGCATPPQNYCARDERRSISELIYFGTEKPGGVVSAEEWSAFLGEVVTPRFPEGLTTWRAAGQWRANDGSLTREDSHVLNLIHANDRASDASIRAIVAEYKTRFKQEAVLRVQAPVCVSF